MLSFKIFFAFLYDFILLCAIWFVAAIPFVIWQKSAEPGAWATSLFQVYLLGITYAYLTYFWIQSGQTPGLKTWKLQLLKEDDYLLSRPQANLRFLWAVLLGSFGWIGLFIPPKYQTLQDRLAQTKIVPTQQ